MPASKVEVKATFMDDNAMLNYFVDVKANDYFYDAVLWAAQKGITSGTDAEHFSPNQPCTRAQIVTFLWRAANSPAPRSSTNKFTDVYATTHADYMKAIIWATEQGITTGTGNGSTGSGSGSANGSGSSSSSTGGSSSSNSGNSGSSGSSTGSSSGTGIKFIG